MACGYNNPIQKNHFRKDWQRRVKTHFNQPGQKASRRSTRAEKAAQIAPRPLDLLRPVVRCPTVRYNRKVRAGRGFTFEELKAVNIAPSYARTVGIAVDHRRVNRNVEGFEANVQRLKEYTARLIVFPRKAGKPKSGEASAEAIAAAKQVNTNAVFPVDKTQKVVSTGKVADVETTDAFRTLRLARSDKRYQGAREKRARDRAAAEK